MPHITAVSHCLISVSCMQNALVMSVVLFVFTATILRDKRSQKKEYDEALGLLKELQKKYVKLHTAAVESAAQIENQNQEALHEINKRKTEINQNSSGYFQH